jgi:PAS domain S-box-containing protein
VDDGVFDTSVDITESNSHYGRIEIGLSTSLIEEVISDAKKKSGGIALLEMALVALFSFVLGTYLTRQLFSLATATGKVARGDFGYQLEVKGRDELARTAQAFNRMSTELKLDKDKRDAILRSALDSIVSMDEEGRIVEFNLAAEQTFGYRKKDVLGKQLAEMIIPPDQREAHNNGLAQFLETGEGPFIDRHVQVTAMRANGEEFPVEVAVTCVDIHTRKLFIAYMRDITERREHERAMEEAREAAEAHGRAKSIFQANMSHELRTPLNALLGFLGLLGEQKNMTDRQLEWISTAQQAGNSLMSLINDTLDFSKIEAGKMLLEPQDFSLRELVDSTISMLAPKARAKGLALSARVDPDVPDYVREDSGRLRQILINLLGNAIKFTDIGGIDLSVSVTGRAAAAHLLFSVTDTGKGIPHEAHESIFREFTQRTDSGQMTSGSGLGLAISKRLVELMGGRLDYESAVGEGTRFWFEIPLEPVDVRQAQGAVSAIRDETPGLRQGRILLADDSPANLMVALAMLDGSGCKVDTVGNGLEAVEAVRTFPYDLVLMDISMPEMDGLEATDAIRKLPGDKGAIPIIAMTAHAIVGDRERFLEAGMNGYIAKPVTRARLHELLSEWLPQDRADQTEHAPAGDLS